MSWLRLGSKYNFLQGKVASRVFLLFVLCALLPLMAMAFFSYRQVTAQLNREAYERLHQACKTAGMTIFERLSLLETDLDALASAVNDGPDGSGLSPDGKLCARLGTRFEGVALLGGTRPRVLCLGREVMPPLLSEEEKQHIRNGHTLVTTRAESGRFARVLIAKSVDPADSARGILMGEISPDYLWSGEGFLSPAMHLLAAGPSGSMLFSDLPGKTDAPELREILQGGSTAGQFEWEYQGETYLAGYWTLFMRPTFLSSWVLVHTEKKDDILEAARSFGYTFLLTLLLSFWIVVFVSLTQIRRNLIPIQQLQEATSGSQKETSPPGLPSPPRTSSRSWAGPSTTWQVTSKT
jgi:hypothetical protein